MCCERSLYSCFLDRDTCQYPLARSRVENHCLPASISKGVINSWQRVGILHSDVVEAAIVNTKPGTPSFFVTRMTGDDQGLSLGSICPPVSTSVTHSSSFFIFCGDIRRGVHHMGALSPVSISCSTASV